MLIGPKALASIDELLTTFTDGVVRLDLLVKVLRTDWEGDGLVVWCDCLSVLFGEHVLSVHRLVEGEVA